MPRLTRTAPFDVVVALHLVAEEERPGTDPAAGKNTLVRLAEQLAVAPSQVHAALARLDTAGLLRPGRRAVNPRALLEFLVHGVRYAFPAVRGPLVAGIPTAYSAPPLNATVDPIDVVVWPAPRHPQAVQGFALAPLYPAAPALLDRAPRTCQLVAITDALRLGDPRVRLSAREALEQRLAARA